MENETSWEIDTFMETNEILPTTPTLCDGEFRGSAYFIGADQVATDLYGLNGMINAVTDEGSWIRKNIFRNVSGASVLINDPRANKRNFLNRL